MAALQLCILGGLFIVVRSWRGVSSKNKKKTQREEEEKCSKGGGNNLLIEREKGAKIKVSHGGCRDHSQCRQGIRPKNTCCSVYIIVYLHSPLCLNTFYVSADKSDTRQRRLGCGDYYQTRFVYFVRDNGYSFGCLLYWLAGQPRPSLPAEQITHFRIRDCSRNTFRMREKYLLFVGRGTDRTGYHHR